MEELTIDNVWPLEGFISQKNAKAGIKYGFIGLGQGGSKIADAFAGILDKNGNSVYKVMIVNSNLGDMTKIKNVPKRYQFPLKGYERGVGKDPEVGRQAFIENGEVIFDEIQNLMSDSDIIFVINSMGGGTGTGAVNVLVEAITEGLHIPVSVITTLPRPNEVESLNAYNAMTELVAKLGDIRSDDEYHEYRMLESLVVLDNDLIVREHSEAPEVPGLTWDFYSNYKVAAILHEWSVLTSLESHFTVDAADLLNHVIRQGALITFAKKKINLDEVTTKDDLVSEIISTFKGKNVLANGFDYEKDMRSMALVVVMPKSHESRLNQDTLEDIRTRMFDEYPHVNFYPGSATSNSKRHAIVYTMASMGGLPERAKNLRKEAEELKKMREERERNASGFSMGEKISTTSGSRVRPAAPARNPFAQSRTESTGNDGSLPKKNPFAKGSSLFKNTR
ncbi:cell division GTPase [Paenibacillus sp. NRS-1783]|uniref:cell division GTPase n=1 Tax=Paenibacillus sp. NRS-1783 TaxID=3233907 RepID=UPI003D27EA64